MSLHRKSVSSGKRSKMQYLKCMLMSLLPVCFAFYGSAQTIEVIVEETVELKPVELTYIVKLDNPIGLWGDFDFEEEEEEKEINIDQINFDELGDILKKKGYSFEKIEHASQSILLDSDTEPAYKLIFKSTDEVKKLEAELAEYDDVEGFIEEARFEQVSDYYASIFPKMMENARKKAELIASSSQLTLGSILAVEELGGGGGEMSELIEWYGSFIKKMGVWKELGADNTVETAKIQLKVRFGLK